MTSFPSKLRMKSPRPLPIQYQFGHSHLNDTTQFVDYQQQYQQFLGLRPLTSFSTLSMQQCNGQPPL